jgi:FkbM family methyltransferase
MTSENSILGLARVIYYKFVEKVKWAPAYNPFTRIYSAKINNVKIYFHQNPFYDIQHDDLDYIDNLPSKPSRCFIDAGSYIGTLAIYLAKSSTDNYIVALEPDPISFKKLKGNIALNQVSNILPMNLGLWNKKTKLDFSYSGGEMSQIVTQKPSSNQITVIETITLDQIRKKINQKIDFVKMDIEGAEIEALAGATKTILADHPKFIIASYHMRGGNTTNSRVNKFLKKYYSTVLDLHTKQLVTIAE